MKGKLGFIITTNELQNPDGVYDFRKHGNEIMWDGKPHTYFSSGLCREVYISPCQTYVLKIAINDNPILKSEDVAKDPDLFRYLSPTIHHNYYEALCYEECPEEYRRYLAKTELLEGCIVKQEFVDVKRIRYSPDLREAGVTLDGRVVIFDYDPLLDNFKRPYNGFYYGKLPEVIEVLSKQIFPE